MKRIIFPLFILLMLSLMLTACSGGNTGDEPSTPNNAEGELQDPNEENKLPSADASPKLEIIMNDKCDYKIVYPAGGDEYIRLAAEKLAAKFLANTQLTIPVISDAESDDTPEKKILVGRTKYEEYNEDFSAMRLNDYSVCVYDTNIVLAAVSEESLASAIHSFCLRIFSNLTDGEDGRNLVMKVDKIKQKFTFNYALPSLTISDKDIRNFKIVYTEKVGIDTAINLRDALSEACGYSLEVVLDSECEVGECEILLADTNRAESALVDTPMPLHYTAKVKGGKLVIKSGGEHSFKKSMLPIVNDLAKSLTDFKMTEGDYILGNLYDDDADSSKPEDSDLRIMTCNILAEFESWSADPAVEMPYLPVDLRKEIFFAALNYYQPTLIGFQEMTPNWYAAAEEYDTEDVWEILKFANPNRHDGEFVFSTVMYRKDLYTLLDSGMKFYSKFINGRSGCYTWAVLKDKSSGQEFCFVSTHWDGTGRPNGFLQAEELTAFVNKMRENYPVFTTGDFNSNEISPEFLQYLEDAEIVDAKGAAENRVNNVGSWHNFLETNLSWGSCDHITATKDTTVLKFQTLYKNELIYCSDHCWLIADIRFD